SLGTPPGLELAMDTSGYVPAPPSVRMDGEGHHLRLRFKDDPGNILTFALERRALRAAIDMTPKLARWPVDPIDITVRIDDPSGVVDVGTFEPKLKVLVGLTEVPVKWSHDGARWTARVEPRNVG